MKYKLEEIVNVTMGQSPKSIYYNTEKNGYPFLQGNKTFGFRYPSFDTYTTVMTKFARAGDVIMSVRAPVGALNITPVDMCLGRGVCSLRMKNGNQSFLFYMMKYYVSRLIKKENGTVFGSVNRDDINGLEVDIPDAMEEQKKIARFLEMIDDKIELNNEINKNLEQQAQALFKSWFVDFEPFDGEHPSSWTKEKLGNACNCVLGGTPSRVKPEYWNGTIPWINSGEVNNFRIIKPSETITELGLTKSATKLLPLKTTVIAITGATLGQVSLLEIDACANQSVVGIIPNDDYPYEYIYPLIKQNINELTSHQTGGAQQHINKQNVENLDILAPTVVDLDKYCNIVHNLYETITNNCFENEYLTSLRDALLPKLMSGELNVSNLDQPLNSCLSRSTDE